MVFYVKKNMKNNYFNIFLIEKYFYRNIMNRIYKHTQDIKPSLSGINLSLIAPFPPLMKRFFLLNGRMASIHVCLASLKRARGRLTSVFGSVATVAF